MSPVHVTSVYIVLIHALLAVHIAGGGVALLAGPVPMFSRKGGLLHRRAGKVYAAAMATVAVSALVLAAVTHNVVLLGLAVFAFFLVFSGVRAIGFRRGVVPGWRDRFVAWLTIAFSGWLFWHGLVTPAVTGLFFGVVGIVLAVRQLWLLRASSPDWLTAHVVAMGGASIATVSAFLVVNLTPFVPAAVVFITPTLAGVPVVVWAAARYRQGGGRIAAAA